MEEKVMRLYASEFILIVVAISLFYVVNGDGININEPGAISAVKTIYPQYADYPSNGLPPKGIVTEKGQFGWYVAFVQFGSGRPILYADCYLVKNSGSVLKTGEFHPEISNNALNLSPKTCSASSA